MNVIFRSFLLQITQTASVAHPASHSIGTVAKAPMYDADHPPPSSAEVNSVWNYSLHGESRDNFTSF
jgi:hypothetical protein